MKFSIILTCVVCAFVLTAYPQHGDPAAKPARDDSKPFSSLHVTDRFRVSLSGVMVGKAKCDDEANIYIRLMTAETSSQEHGIYRAPIVKIRPDGSVAATFRITDLSPDVYAKDFFVTGDGRVFDALFMPDTSVYVAEFAANGVLKTRIKVEAAGVSPYQIAGFRSGEFLLSGTIAKKDYRPFTGVFDKRGNLIREIYEPEDEASRIAAKAGDSDVLPEYSEVGNTFAWRGDAVLGSDENVYLLRATSPALIYVISRKGEVIRKFRVDPGEPGLVARSLKPAPGKLAVSFLRKGLLTGTVKVVDLKGNLLVSHSFDSAESERIPGLPGCYNGGNFSVLDDDVERNIFLEKATPK